MEKTHTYKPSTEKHIYNDPFLAAEAAATAVEKGFTAVKFDPRSRTLHLKGQT